jgi:arsenate reductase
MEKNTLNRTRQVDRDMVQKKNVLFVCSRNAGRSQMAEGLLNAWHGDHYYARSAGLHPGSVSPLTVRVMREIGIDISHHTSKSIDAVRGEPFDLVITLCDQAGEDCPLIVDAAEVIHKSFTDPKSFKGTEDEVLPGFRRVRDEIGHWINEYFGREHV